MTTPCLGEMTSPVADATPTATVGTSHHRHEPTLNATRGERVIVAATVAVGAGLMIVVGLDGSPAWQLLRLVLVAAVTAATCNALDTATLAGGRAWLSRSDLSGRRSVPASGCPTSPRPACTC